MTRRLLANPIKQLVSQQLKFGSFTDNLDNTGFIDFGSSLKLPAGAIVLGWKADIKTGFTGDVSADVYVGKSGDVTAFSELGKPTFVEEQYVGEYEFALDGGLVSTITLRSKDKTQIPNGAYIIDCLIAVETAPTSGGAATLAMGSGEATNDIQAAAVVTGGPWSTLGGKRGSALTRATTAIKTTAPRDITATVAVAALTAGKIKAVASYVRPLPFTTASCFTAATAKRMAASGLTSFLDAATTPRVTVKSAADFTAVAAGEMKVTIYYIDTNAKAI